MSTTTTDRAEIEARIPHRPPFLFLDRIVDEGAESLVGEWRVPEDLECFQGHYPGRPVLPGVILCEHVFQAASCLIASRTGGFRPDEGVPLLAKIELARFRRIVRPGETVRTETSIRERLGSAWYLSGTVQVEGELTLRTRFVLSAAKDLEKGGD